MRANIRKRNIVKKKTCLPNGFEAKDNNFHSVEYTRARVLYIYIFGVYGSLALKYYTCKKPESRLLVNLKRD